MLGVCMNEGDKRLHSLVMQRTICHDSLSDLGYEGIDDIILCRETIRVWRFASIC